MNPEWKSKISVLKEWRKNTTVIKMAAANSFLFITLNIFLERKKENRREKKRSKR